MAAEYPHWLTRVLAKMALKDRCIWEHRACMNMADAGWISCEMEVVQIHRLKNMWPDLAPTCCEELKAEGAKFKAAALSEVLASAVKSGKVGQRVT